MSSVSFHLRLFASRLKGKIAVFLLLKAFCWHDIGPLSRRVKKNPYSEALKVEQDIRKTKGLKELFNCMDKKLMKFIILIKLFKKYY